MIAVHDRLIVRVNMAQKDTMIVGGIKVSTALKFEINYREKSPVVAEIVQGNKFLHQGQIILNHHNHYQPPSPYYLENDLFSIPFNLTVFGVLDERGLLRPMCGNMICERVEIPSLLPIPVEQRKTYIDRVVVVDPGWTKHKPGSLLFHRKNAGYDIVYNWQGIERRITKVHENQVVGIAIPKK